jgi:ribosomal protein S6
MPLQGLKDEMKRYEGLFILNTAGREDGAKDILDKIFTEISAVGGKVETVQKMDRKHFARVANKKHNAGFYANVIFNGAPEIISQLNAKFSLNEEVFRVMFTESPEPKPAAK